MHLHLHAFMMRFQIIGHMWLQSVPGYCHLVTTHDDCVCLFTALTLRCNVYEMPPSPSPQKRRSYTHILSIPNCAWLCVCTTLHLSVICVFVCSRDKCVCVCGFWPLALSRGQRLLRRPLMDAQLESGTHKGSQGHSYCLLGPHHLAELCSLPCSVCVCGGLCVFLHLNAYWEFLSLITSNTTHPSFPSKAKTLLFSRAPCGRRVHCFDLRCRLQDRASNRMLQMVMVFLWDSNFLLRTDLKLLDLCVIQNWKPFWMFWKLCVLMK